MGMHKNQISKAVLAALVAAGMASGLSGPAAAANPANITFTDTGCEYYGYAKYNSTPGVVTAFTVPMSSGAGCDYNGHPSTRQSARPVAPPRTGNSTTPTLTQGQFVRQAVSQGVAPEVAAKAWGNPYAMSKIPVSSTLTIETSSGYTATTTSDAIGAPLVADPNNSFAAGYSRPLSGITTRRLASATVWNHWTTCTARYNNSFGWMLNQLQMDKQWDSVGTKVYNPAVQVYGSGAWGWSFEGIVNTNDYYSSANGNAQGAHTSYRQGKYVADIDGHNLSVNVKATSNASTCTKG